jgi:hypothetical protein
MKQHAHVQHAALAVHTVHSVHSKILLPLPVGYILLPLPVGYSIGLYCQALSTVEEDSNRTDGTALHWRWRRHLSYLPRAAAAADFASTLNMATQHCSSSATCFHLKQLSLLGRTPYEPPVPLLALTVQCSGCTVPHTQHTSSNRFSALSLAPHPAQCCTPPSRCSYVACFQSRFCCC